MSVDLLPVPNILDFNGDLKLQGFKVYAIDTQKNLLRQYNRKDFYKICVIPDNFGRAGMRRVTDVQVTNP